MAADRWVALDFETATREPTSACALGLAVIEDDAVVEQRAWLIQPPFNEYEYRNTLVHGLSSEDTALAPEFDELWWEITPILKGARLLAHNAPFDMRVLRALVQTRSLWAPPYEYACTVAMSRRALPDLPRHTLDVVCDHLGVRLKHHDAESDAVGCAQIALACAYTAGADTVSEAVEKLGVNLGHL